MHPLLPLLLQSVAWALPFGACASIASVAVALSWTRAARGRLGMAARLPPSEIVGLSELWRVGKFARAIWLRGRPRRDLPMPIEKLPLPWVILHASLCVGSIVFCGSLLCAFAALSCPGGPEGLIKTGLGAGPTRVQQLWSWWVPMLCAAVAGAPLAVVLAARSQARLLRAVDPRSTWFLSWRRHRSEIARELLAGRALEEAVTLEVAAAPASVRRGSRRL